MTTLTKSLFAAFLTLALQNSAGCAEAPEGREVKGLELIPISERDEAVVDTFVQLRAEPLANGVLALAWDDVAGDVAFVEIWRPDMSKWSDLSGGEWNPALEHWGERVAQIPAGAAQWIDIEAMVVDDNRYILRTIGFDGQVSAGFVIEARPAQTSDFRAGNWSDADTSGIGTHDIAGEYVNVRGDAIDTVLFTANRGELATLSYQSKKYGGKDYFEVYFKTGVHAGQRGWVAKEFLVWSVLEVCSDNAQIRTGNDLGTVIGTAAKGSLAYVTSGQVRNTGNNRYFQVSVGGKQGFVATSALCAKGSVAPAQQGGGNGGNQGGSYDAALGKLLAQEAYAGSVGYSMGRCYQYAWAAMKRAIGMTESRASELGIPSTSAYQFGDWADAHPSALYSDFGLKKITSTAANAPVGSVVVWEPGQCGFNSTHGHIEIVASPGYACSDFCGYMYNDCGSPRVYMPVK
jgi:hypothetical protein